MPRGLISHKNKNIAGVKTIRKTFPKEGLRGSGNSRPNHKNKMLMKADKTQQIVNTKNLFKLNYSVSILIFRHYLDLKMSGLVDLNALDTVNPSLTRYGRQDLAPVLPLREEPDLLSWLEASGRLVTDEESGSDEISTVEEEELSALMGEKEEYTTTEEPSDEQWEE